ncbi:hypothetical protein FHS04_002826 [Mesoflavibacter sabulilitoris]|uniref:Uncharacterized protein n=1 Tax=Mesoflavibacter zeaxanthinifaciens subsp. sabulilitoris TaxID=1520893 RepID=A0A2T1NNR7_9FLAO|nr:hypothetical protein [Mesoflavibacter zeaxanthinifaciens]MBB3125282.1 hypothetical protein [Mesoflavibacter zeaxanthinifaciens subsp. sabulilitoris]PSG94518.1 hypothetical protein C7H61_00865 [Mesoflavibacter zeaxanthinifaciens subsp. sabulilitoris]
MVLDSIVDNLQETRLISVSTANKLKKRELVEKSELINLNSLFAMYEEYDNWNIAVNLYTNPSESDGSIDFHSCLYVIKNDYNDKMILDKRKTLLMHYEKWFNDLVNIKILKSK